MQKELRTRSPNKTQQTALQSIRKFCSNPIGLEQVSVRAFSFLQLSAIMQTYLDKHSSHRHHPSMASDWKSRWWSMSIFPCGWPHYMATRIRSATMIMYWTKINHFWTDQDHRASCNKKRCIATYDKCQCGKRQTMFHIISSYPQTKLEGGLQQLHLAEDAAVQWLTSHGS